MPSARPRVLVMDDSELILAMTREALERAGFEVSTAKDITELEAFRDRPVDLLVIDVQMPEAYGDDLALTLKEAYGVTTPILLFSTLDETELAPRAAEAKVAGYVSKRAGLEVLVERVKTFIGQPPPDEMADGRSS